MGQRVTNNSAESEPKVVREFQFTVVAKEMDTDHTVVEIVDVRTPDNYPLSCTGVLSMLQTASSIALEKIVEIINNQQATVNQMHQQAAVQQAGLVDVAGTPLSKVAEIATPKGGN